MPEPNITELLQKAAEGGSAAKDALYEGVYEELKKIARGLFRRERVGHTLQPTGLVNEAYLKLVDQERATYKNRQQFQATAATVMRRILVDYARQRGRSKRGGDLLRVDLEKVVVASKERGIDFLALDEALKKLERFDKRQAQIVEYRFFADMSVREIATALGVSEKTVKRDWQVARARLYRELKDDG